MTTTIDPRFRERRIEVQREAGRKRLRYLLAIAALVVPLGLAFVAVESPLLDVDHVRIEGVKTIDPVAVEQAAGLETGAALLRVDTGAVAARIERLPWIADAEVSRGLPGTLRIAVTERAAVAYMRRDDAHVALVASDGTVIADSTAPPPGAIEVRGAADVPAAGARLEPGGAAGAAGAMPPELAARIGAVDVTDDAVTLVLHDGGTVRLCNTTDLEAKGAAALAVLQRLGDRGFEYVDVCVPQSPVAK
jgi:cell division septal protein FtsQ